MFGDELFDFDGNGEVDALEFMIGCNVPDDFDSYENAIDLNPYDLEPADYENWLDDLND